MAYESDLQVFVRVILQLQSDVQSGITSAIASCAPGLWEERVSGEAAE